MSRSRAKQELSLKEFRADMKQAGIWTSCVSKSTLDEAPGAYKDTDTIRDTLGDTVEVVKTLKPVYNFKASGGHKKDRMGR